VVELNVELVSVKLVHHVYLLLHLLVLYLYVLVHVLSAFECVDFLLVNLVKLLEFSSPPFLYQTVDYDV
jgi:hypothetical protein